MASFIDKTMGDFLDECAVLYRDDDALVYVDRGLRLTYHEFNEICKTAAKGFLKLGVKKGDHVAVWATNYPEWLISMFALPKIGAVLVTVNTNYKIFELEYLLKQSDADTLILMEGFKDANYMEILNKLVPELAASRPGELSCEKLPCLKRVIYLDDKDYPGTIKWQEVLDLGAKVPDRELYAVQNTLTPHEVINMQYTSGTTGFPKGVMLTHYNILNNGFFIGENMKFTNRDRLCIPVPFFHCFGCVLAVLACVTHGAAMVPILYFRPQEVLEAVEKEKCTALHGVPTMFIFLLGHEDFDKYNLSTLRTGIMAGSPCPIEVMKQAMDKMGMTEITIAYGQTESSPVITQTSTDDPIELRVATVGRAMPNVEVKIVDPETGKTLPPGVSGELCARGYGIMKGYYKMEEATRQAIDDEGWLHTGDLAIVDENGYYKISGRIKDMIIRGGENIYPREIEELLYTNDAVADVQVIGIPSRKYGEEIMAFVILKEGAAADEDTLKGFVLSNMARHKVPSHIRFVAEFPMTASGKIQKFKLRDMAVDMLNLHDEAKIEMA